MAPSLVMGGHVMTRTPSGITPLWGRTIRRRMKLHQYAGSSIVAHDIEQWLQLRFEMPPARHR